MSIGSSLGIFMTFIEHLSTFKFVLHSCSVWEKMHSAQENSLHFFKRHFYTTTASHENSAENKSWLFPSYFWNSTHKMWRYEKTISDFITVQSVQRELIIWKFFRFQNSYPNNIIIFSSEFISLKVYWPAHHQIVLQILNLLNTIFFHINEYCVKGDSD